MFSWSRVLIVAVASVLLCALTIIAVPPTISYQGRLTDDSGTPVADDTYTVTFKIYNTAVISLGPIWTETQDATTSNGLFSVNLGAVVPLTTDVFDGGTKYLSLAVNGGSESDPRIPMVSVPYAMVAGTVEGSTTDCADCDDRFINVIGPETITASADTTLTIVNTGSDIKCGVNIRVDGSNDVGGVYGMRATAANNGSGNFPAYGGLFQASGGNAMQYGVYGSATNNAPIFPVYGVYGRGYNASPGGDAFGGYFAANGSDPSNHYGAGGYAHAEGAALAVGLFGEGSNPNEGSVTGGLFKTGSNGTGSHFGVKSFGYGNSDSAVTGVYGYADNHGWGRTVGGDFVTGSNGFGRRYGVHSLAAATSDSVSTAFYGQAYNNGSGNAYGGYFEVLNYGSGRKIGLYTEVEGDDDYIWGLSCSAINSGGSKTTVGVSSYTSGSGSGEVIGADITCHGTGTGIAKGLDAYVLGGTSLDAMYGVYADASGGSNFAGSGYGAYFSSIGFSSAQNQYAAYGLANSYSNYASYGYYGRSGHYGSGNSYGGYFLVDSTGTGTSYGVRSVGLSKGTATAYGIASVAANKWTANAYGGYFEALDFGSGGHYGIYAKAPATGYAGYFEGNLRVTGSLVVIGAKSAAVRMDNGDYHKVYCQESPENWFEDFGEGQLVNGRAHIELDPLFLQTVTIDNNNPIKVFVQLNDPDCNGTAVVRGSTGFDVVELMHGTGSASFSYRVVAKRRGYEAARLDVMPGPTPEEATAATVAASEALQADEESVEQDRIKQLEANLNRDDDHKSPLHESN